MKNRSLTKLIIKKTITRLSSILKTKKIYEYVTVKKLILRGKSSTWPENSPLKNIVMG